MVEILFLCIKGVYDDYKWTAKTQKIGYKYKCFGFLVNIYGPGKLAFYGFDQKKKLRWNDTCRKSKKSRDHRISLTQVLFKYHYLVLFFFFCVIVHM